MRHFSDRRIRLTDVERVVEVAATAHSEEQVDGLIGFDDAIVVGDHLNAQVAVDAVLLRRRRFIGIEIDLLRQELRRNERPALDAAFEVDRVQQTIVRGHEHEAFP